MLVIATVLMVAGFGGLLFFSNNDQETVVGGGAETIVQSDAGSAGGAPPAVTPATTSGSVVLNHDRQEVRADEGPVRVDVLANDVGITEEVAQRIELLILPECGRLFVKDGALYYLPVSGCEGNQVFYYGLAGTPEVAEVTILVLPATQQLAPDRAPAVQDQSAYALKIEVPSLDQQASAGARPEAVLRDAPSAIGDGATSVFALAQIENPEPVAVPTASPDLTVGLEGATPASVGLPWISGDIGTEISMAPMPAGLSAMPMPAESLGPALPVAPADPADEPLPVLAAAPPDPAAQPSSVDPAPGAEAVGLGRTASIDQAVRRPPDPARRAVTTPPSAAPDCVTPPEVSFSVRPAGITQVIIAAPCQGGTVAELRYSALRLGVAIDSSGNGRIDVPGFAPASDAQLGFADGKAIDFVVPFSGLDRIERIGVTWDAAVELTLHALEFGAELDSAGHVNSGQPRSYRQVRKAGGGFLIAFAPVNGVGNSAQIYSYFGRKGGPNGVVKLFVDFTSRNRAQLEGTCGDGPQASPRITLLRYLRGRASRPLNSRLDPRDCTTVAGLAGGLTTDLEMDVVVPRR